jgi:hypothetical protein
MKAFIALFLSTLLFLTISFHLNGQSILNGGFEDNTFPAMCQFQITNSTYNPQISNIEAYSNIDWNDIIHDVSCPYGPPNNGDWNGTIEYLNSFSGANITGNTALSFALSSTITSGNQYRLTYYDKAKILSPNYTIGTVSVGVSLTSTSSGTNIGTSIPIQDIWSQRSFTFTAPFSGTAFITATVLDHGEVGKVAWVHIDDFELELIPLPVELMSFQGQPISSENLLTWQTISEENNKGFEIQKSKAGLDWENIGFVDGKGTTDDFNSYEFIDSTPFFGENYYRLKQLDAEGKFEFSNVIVVKTAQRENDIQIFPNPTSGKIEITGVAIGAITIMNSIGSTVKETTLPNENIDISELPGGIYFISIHTNNQLITKRIIKK